MILWLTMKTSTRFWACNETFAPLNTLNSSGNIKIIWIEFTLQGQYFLFSATCCFIVCSLEKLSVFIFVSVPGCHFLLSMKQTVPKFCETVICPANCFPHLYVKSNRYERSQYSTSLHILSLTLQNPAVLIMSPILKNKVVFTCYQKF